MRSLTGFLMQDRGLAGLDSVRLVPPPESWFAQVTDVATGILTILTVGLFVALIWMAIRLRKSFDEAQASLAEMRRDLHELVDRASKLAENAAAVAVTVREEVGHVRETVDYANRRARHAVTALADRVDEFNSALAAVQRDTQGVLVTALAAARGIRAGVSAMRKRPRRPQPADMAYAHDDADDDSEPPADLPARPRLRRRVRAED
jgi:hypothetical protein